jgi:Tol biopolymer transport system component
MHPLTLPKPSTPAVSVRRFSAVLALWMLCTGPIARAEKPFAVYVMKSDGTQVRKLAQVDGYTVHEAARWSHDGKRVAFDAIHANGGYEFFVVNADGSGLLKLGSGKNPDWSPDDKQIVFDHGAQIFVQNLDGQGLVQVGRGDCPRWSPDGGKLAFADGNMLYVMDLASSEQEPIFEKPFTTLYRGSCWSPDGKHLAVSVRPVPRVRRQVLIVSAQGAEHGLNVRLQNEAGGQMGFSPDGKHLAFDNAFFIHVVEVDGKSEARQLPDQKALNRDPNWSPDGQWLVFTSNRD